MKSQVAICQELESLGGHTVDDWAGKGMKAHLGIPTQAKLPSPSPGAGPRHLPHIGVSHPLDRNSD